MFETNILKYKYFLEKVVKILNYTFKSKRQLKILKERKKEKIENIHVYFFHF